MVSQLQTFHTLLLGKDSREVKAKRRDAFVFTRVSREKTLCRQTDDDDVHQVDQKTSAVTGRRTWRLFVNDLTAMLDDGSDDNAFLRESGTAGSFCSIGGYQSHIIFKSALLSASKARSAKDNSSTKPQNPETNAHPDAQSPKSFSKGHATVSAQFVPLHNP